MADQQIIVEIAPDGGVTVSAKGFAGKACQDATKQIEAALGRTTGDMPTPEMYKPATASIKAGG